MKKHVTIVGGGVIGLAIAWELARREFRVTVLERGEVGHGTSWAAAGILPAASLGRTTDAIDELRGLSHQMFPKWTTELQAITGIDSEFNRCGGLFLAETAGERASLVGMTSYWDDLGIACESLSSKALVEREPGLSLWADRFPNSSAWWVPDECQIRPPRYLQALEAACRIASVEICENANVDDVEFADHPRVRVNGDWTSSDTLVLCGGVWTGQISDRLQLESSLVPVRGQMLLLKTDVPVVSSVVNVGHRYIVCRKDGYTLVGSCEEEKGFELGTSDDMLDSLRKFANQLVPTLEDAQPCDSWSGLRPMTFDGFPMIGRLPNSQHVYVAAGHFRSGLHLSPGTAVAVADLIMGQTPPICLDAFRIGKQQSTNL
jgi:glycine oxidase